MSNIVFLDLETTGLDSDKHALIEVAFHHYKDGVFKSKFCAQFSSQGKEVDLGALRANKRTYGSLLMDHDDSRLKEMIDYLLRLPEDKKNPLKFGGHNTAFDVLGLKRFLKDNKVAGLDRMFAYSVIDTSTIGSFLRDCGIINYDRMSLATLAKTLGISVDETRTHGADYDTDLTAKCYFAMIELGKSIAKLKG